MMKNVPDTFSEEHALCDERPFGEYGWLPRDISLISHASPALLYTSQPFALEDTRQAAPAISDKR